MEIEFVDQKIRKVKLSSLALGDTFLEGELNDVCMYLGKGANGEHEYIILGEFPEIIESQRGNNEVRPVKTKLLVEI